jgi:hypothetical protein
VDSVFWTDRAIRTLVPDNATSGAISVTPASGRRLAITVHVLPRVAFIPATLAWQTRTAFPRSGLGVALAVAAFPVGGTLQVSLYAAGGAEPLGGDSVFAPDSGVYVAAVQASGAGPIGPWTRQLDTSDATRSHVLPVRRAFAAAAVATRYNSRFDGAALYVLGGIDASGRAVASVFGAAVDANAVIARFEALEPLPAPVIGASAVVQRGRLYVFGGADSIGRPQRAVYVGRIGLDGHIDGWYQQPPLSTPRAYGGGVVLDGRAVVFGGLADSAPPGGGLDPTPTRLAGADTAAVSLTSGFFTGGWGGAGTVLPEGRSQFATLYLGNVVLVVGGYYSSVSSSPVEALAAPVTGDTLGAFTGPVGTSSIASQSGGTLVTLGGVSWRDANGMPRGLVLGGFDLTTRLRRTGAWGF